MHLLYETLAGQCEYTAQPKGSFWYHSIDTKGGLLLMVLTSKLVFIVLFLSF